VRSLAVIATAVSVVACGGGAAATGPRPTSPDPPSRAAEVYTSVLRALIRDARTGSSGRAVVYAVDGALPGAGDPTRQWLDARPKRPFADALKSRLTQQLAGLASVQFVGRGTSVLVGKHGGSTLGHVVRGGILVTLGPIRGDRRRVRVGASSWRNGLDGHWQTYAVTLVDGHWAVTGTVGPVAIS
jgi:hypothetical protein